MLTTRRQDELRAGLADLIAAVRPSDTLLAIGSVSNGLASSSAELDLLLIGPGTTHTGGSPSMAPMSSASYRLASGRAVGVRFCTEQELLDVCDLVGRFDSAFMESSIGLNLPSIDLTTAVLLHEVRCGVVIANDSIAHNWRQMLRLDQLPVYLAVQRLQRFAARHRNVEWHLKDGEHESALWTLRECLEELLAAALAVVGETNPRKRWHLQLLRQHETEYGRDTVESFIRLLCQWPADGSLDVFGEAWASCDALLRMIVRQCPELQEIADVATKGV